MTAAKVMDIMSWLPGCSGQAADAVSAYTQVKNGRCINVIKKFQSQNVQIFGYVYTTTYGQNHGPVWKTQSFLSKGICTVILWQDSYGNSKLRKFYWNTVEKSFKLGMFICQPSKRTILIRVCGQYQNGRQDRKHRTDLDNSHGRL